MEGFLQTCKHFRIRLFKGLSFNAEGIPDQAEDEISNQYQERYELNDFQLLCRNCYKCFADDKALKKHTWGCTRAKIFPCRFCDKSFRHKNDIDNHERKHTGEKPYKCHYEGCERAFSIKSGLQTHIKVVHQNFRFQCDECEAEFSSSVARRNHKLVKHSTERAFSCGDCGKCFATNSFLLQHRRNVHLKKRRPKLTAKTDEVNKVPKPKREFTPKQMESRKRAWQKQWMKRKEQKRLEREQRARQIAEMEGVDMTTAAADVLHLAMDITQTS